MHTFKRDDSVAVINQTIGGRFIVEGNAKVVRPVSDLEESYIVEFTDGQRCQRFIDPQAQQDPTSFIDRLNAAR